MSFRPRLPVAAFLLPLLMLASPMAWGQMAPHLTLTGIGEGIQDGLFGWSVWRAGDADSDGRSDLFVTGYDIGLNGGPMVLLDGDTGAFITQYSLGNYTNGPSSATRRLSLDVFPDLDGDGVRDVLVGVPSTTSTRGSALLLNGATGALIRSLGSIRQSINDAFGVSVAAIGDAVGDEAEDFVIGSPGADLFGTNRGALFTFDGGTGDTTTAYGPIPRPTPLSTFFGDKLFALGDVDGDGKGDFADSEPTENVSGAPSQSGRVYVFSGAFAGFRFELFPPRHRFGGRFGEDVAPVGDLDGDGVPDILVGAPGDLRDGDTFAAGRAWLFSGASGALLDSLDHPEGGPRDGLFGWDVAALGDVSGDGVPDFAIGSPGTDDPWCSWCKAGRAYVFSGATRALLHVLASPNPEEGGAFGWSVSAAGDTDGDGRPEVIVGAPRENPGAAPRDAGRAYVFRLPLPTAAEPAPATVALTASPNPARGAARLAFTLAAPGPVHLALYDSFGREVAVVAEGVRAAGPQEVAVEVGRLAPGVYAARLTANGATVTRQIVVVR